MPTRRVLLALSVVVLASLALLGCQPTSPGSATGPDLTKLPLGDGKVSSTPKKGYVMRCGNGMGPGGPGGGATVTAPWINTRAKTFNLLAKPIVQGKVPWPDHKLTIEVVGSSREITTNDLPDHDTGIFPIAHTDPAFRYDQNPNHISPQSISVTVPAAPEAASRPTCVSPGPIGVTYTGVVIFDALDAEDRDAVAHEVQDLCNGHPDPQSIYHYHDLTSCLKDSSGPNSRLMGYALDGYGIYGPKQDGKILTTKDLDACHGITSTVLWNGKEVKMYHYVATADFPYTISCFHGTPAKVTTTGRS